MVLLSQILLDFTESGAVTRERSSSHRSHRSHRRSLCVTPAAPSQYFACNSYLICKYWRRHGPIPGPLVFSLYTRQLVDLLQGHGFEYILNDLCQIYISCFELHIHTINDLCGSCAFISISKLVCPNQQSRLFPQSLLLPSCTHLKKKGHHYILSV